MTTEVTYYFPKASEAWAFMRHLDKQGYSAGFPSLRKNADGMYTVRVAYQGHPKDHSAKL